MSAAQTAIVTGASRGIGAAIAKLLAKEGYAVAVNYASSKAEAEAVVAEIEREGGRALAVQADMGREEEVLRLFATVKAQLPPLAALVNNAAVNLRDGDGSVHDVSWQSAERVMLVNVVGAMIAAREALKAMKETGGGIVNITSEAARFGGNRIAAYASSKAALATFTVGFAREAAAHRVRVNALSPAIIATDAHIHGGPERLKALESSIPLGRMGSPEEVAEAVAWLLSEKSSYISGAVIPISGGR